jgi:quercetin dioxygenase-like cupin family protein
LEEFCRLNDLYLKKIKHKLRFWMISVKNLASVSDQEWSSTEKYPGVRWKFLIDSDFDGSSGLSLGFAEIAPGGNLTLHYHSPAEIYVVTNGTGILNKSGELETIKKGDVFYIAVNDEHALKNDVK